MHDKRQIEIDFVPFAAHEIAQNTNLYSQIDEVYNKNKSLYYENAKQNEYFNHPYLHFNKLIIDVYTIKVLGIILTAPHEKEHPLFKYIFDWAKKTNRRFYKYIDNYQGNPISFTKFLIDNPYVLTGEIGSSTTFPSKISLFFFMCQLMETEVLVDDSTSNEILTKIHICIHFNKYKEFMLNEADEKRFNNLKKILKKKIGNVRTLTEYTTSEREFSNFIDFYTSCTQDIINLEDTANKELSSQEIDQILKFYAGILNPKSDKDDEIIIERFITAMTFRGFAKEYDLAKKEIMEKTEELNELSASKKLRENLRKANQSIASLEDKVMEREKALEEKQSELNQTQLTIDRLQRKNHSLESEIETLGGKIKEKDIKITQLNNIITKLLSESDEIRLEQYQDKQIAIIGGHPKQTNKLKQKFPTFVFIDTDLLRVDTKTLKNMDLIAFFYEYINHTMYSKIVEYARKKEIPIRYIRGTNENLFLVQLQ